MPKEGEEDCSQSNEIFYLETTEQSGGEEAKCESSKLSESTTSTSSNSDDLGESSTSRKPPIGAITVPLGISPPNFVPFEDIMKSANEMSKIALMNEIVFNKDFRLEKSGGTSELEKAVRQNMQKAFWDLLKEQLAESPPIYTLAVSLIEEIKETLLLFLMPQHSHLKNEINEILDIGLIKQSVENGIFDFQRYAHYVLSVCSRLCCPARDEMIQKLTLVNEVIPLFKGIFELLEIMRLDFANFYIKQFRPHIQLASVEYEREKFKQLIETHQRYQMDVLEFTSLWLRKNYESVDLSQESELKHMFGKVLTTSYIDLLKCINPSLNYYLSKQQDNANNSEDDFPETLLLVRNRIDAIRDQIYQVTLISSVFVVTFAAIGEPLQSVKEFRLKLKNELEVIINSPDDGKSPSLQYLKLDELKSILTSASLQVIKSIEEALEDYNIAPQAETRALSSDKLESLKFQINELASPTNRIRSVMERRILEFIERVLSANSVPIQVPSGLSSFATELTRIAGEYTRLVAYNRAVYSPYYTKIIADITGPTRFIPPHELQAIEKSFYD